MGTSQLGYGAGLLHPVLLVGVSVGLPDTVPVPRQPACYTARIISSAYGRGKPLLSTFSANEAAHYHKKCKATCATQLRFGYTVVAATCPAAPCIALRPRAPRVSGLLFSLSHPLATQLHYGIMNLPRDGVCSSEAPDDTPVRGLHLFRPQCNKVALYCRRWLSSPLQ